MGSKDSVDPKFVSGCTDFQQSTPTPSNDGGDAERIASEGEAQAQPKRRSRKESKKSKRARKSGDDEGDKWLVVFRESQEREERMLENFKKIEEIVKGLFLTAIKEFGEIMKKE